MHGIVRSVLVCSVLTMAAAAPRLITFDATGTLMRLRRPIGAVYRDALAAGMTLGQLTRGREKSEDVIAASMLDASEIERAFGGAYRRACDAHPCFGAGAISSRDWWAGVVRETYEGAGVSERVLDAVLSDHVFPTLYESFATSAAWELHEASAPVLQQLARWRASLPSGELTIGVVSNFDDRLEPLLESLDCRQYFDFVLTSREAGIEKPEQDIFDLACDRAGLGSVSRGEAVHVGDTFQKDIVGAAGAGWRAVYVASDEALSMLEPEAFVAMCDTEHERVDTIGFVPRVIGAPASTALVPEDDADEQGSGAQRSDSWTDEEDPHVDEEDVDGERAWFLGQTDGPPSPRS